MNIKKWLHNRRLQRLMICATLLYVVGGIGARVHQIQSDDTFRTALARNQFVLVFFYQKSCHACTSGDYRKQLKVAHRAFERTSTLWEYKEGDLFFIKNSTQDSQMNRIAEKFGIPPAPSYALFKDGGVVEKDGASAVLQGFASEDELQSFIDEYIGDELAERRDEKADARERRRELRDYYWSMAWPYYTGCGYYPYGCGYGYPYGYGCGYGCGYPRGYVGFGFCL